MKKQHGAALMVTVFILGIIVTMGVVSMSHIVSTNFKITGNTIRTEQAFQAASGGIDYGLYALNQDNAKDLSESDYNFPDVPVIGGATFKVSASQIGADNELVRITSQGFTDDNTSGRPNKVLTAIGQKRPLVAYTPVPIVGKNTVRMGFDTKVVNHTGSFGTMWSGGGITFSNYVWDIKDVNGDESTVMGMYASDSELINSTTEKMFENFFAADKSTVRSLSEIIECSTCSDGDVNEGLIWIDGDLDIGISSLGTIDDPVILIVTGNVNFTGSYTDFKGVIYANSVSVESDTSNIIIRGAIIAEDFINIDGTDTQVIYDTTILENVANRFSGYAMVPGTWRDM